jgi:hypothetical protein
MHVKYIGTSLNKKETKECGGTSMQRDRQKTFRTSAHEAG